MNPKLKITTVFALFIGSFTFLPTVNGAPGDLDTTFSQDGKIFHEFGSGTDNSAYATALQSDGKIVVADASIYGGHGSCGIARYNVDGTLDTTFDGDGKKNIQVLNAFTCRALKIQTDGKIVVAGASRVDLVWFSTLVRYNPDGSLDGKFGNGGKVIMPTLRQP